MVDIRIEHLERDRLSAARKLVWRVFPQQTVLERLSFWAIANRHSPLMDRMAAWAGVADFLDFWGAIDQETGTLLGTTGLYLYTHDAARGAHCTASNEQQSEVAPSTVPSGDVCGTATSFSWGQPSVNPIPFVSQVQSDP